MKKKYKENLTKNNHKCKEDFIKNDHINFLTKINLI